MSWDRILAYVGIIVGLPGFLILFMGDRYVLGIFALIVVALLFWHLWSLQRPNFTVVEIDKLLRIHDQGQTASFVREQTMKANHKGLTEFWIKGISADGQIERILIDDNKPDEVRVEAGDILVCKRFPQPLKRGKEFKLRHSYDLINSFPNNTEMLIHTANFKTKVVRMRVELPPGRPCKAARASLRFGGQFHAELARPTVYSGNKRIEIEIRKPKLGGDYYLEWDW